MSSEVKLDDSPIINAFKRIQVALMIVGPTGRILHCNPAADSLFGYDSGKLMGRPVFDVLSVTSVAELSAYIEPPAIDAIIKGIAGRTANGQKILLGAQMTVWTEDENGLQHALVLRDIADEVSAERRSRSELERANNAIVGAKIGVFDYVRKTESVNVSDLWRELLGVDSVDSDDLKREWLSKVHPDDLDAALESVRLCLEDQCERHSCEYRLRSKDDSRWLWIRSDMSIAERDRQGNVSRLSGAMTDITDRKATETALRRSEEQFRSAFQSTTIGMAIVSFDGKFLRVNPALCALFGYSEQDLVNTDIQALTHSEDQQDTETRFDLFKSGEASSYQFEKRYIRANGAVMWGSLSVGIVRDDEGRPDHMVSQIVDVTEQRRLNELKSQFVSTVSHELRTPLTSILGSLMLLSSMDDEPFSDQAQRLLYIAQQNGDRLHALINDVLDFEKFSAQQMRFDLSTHRIVTLVEEAILANLASGDKFGVRFDMVCPDRTLTGVVDPQRFQQVMTNLLSNAAKFAHTGSTVRVVVEEQEDAVRIAVTSDGEKIPESFREHLFQPFSQADSASTRARGGTGLGLAITKQIVEQTGGAIDFDSTEGEGTTFWFTVPSPKPQ